MHKRLINELVLQIQIEPDGPLLIKASDRGGVDPTRPDMEFVRTWQNGRETIYLPGSSLKGVLRAHCEKIARTVASPQSLQTMETRLFCDPMKADASAGDGSCNEKFNRIREKLSAEEIFKRSCLICQIFGNTDMASHLRISDAYPAAESHELTNRTEVRNGVAIDRVYGSVAVGPFQFETATQGAFATTLIVRNFTTSQLGLLGLAMRDLRQQRLSIGFAKSRGLGRIKATIASATIRFPMGDLLAEVEDGHLPGVGAILHAHEPAAASAYGYRAEDRLTLEGLRWQADEWGGRELNFDATQAAEGGSLDGIWKAAVGAWKKVVQDGR